jgi:hypothetical protein
MYKKQVVEDVLEAKLHTRDRLLDEYNEMKNLADSISYFGSRIGINTGSLEMNLSASIDSPASNYDASALGDKLVSAVEDSETRKSLYNDLCDEYNSHMKDINYRFTDYDSLPESGMELLPREFDS